MECCIARVDVYVPVARRGGDGGGGYEDTVARGLSGLEGILEEAGVVEDEITSGKALDLLALTLEDPSCEMCELVCIVFGN